MVIKTKIFTVERQLDTIEAAQILIHSHIFTTEVGHRLGKTKTQETGNTSWGKERFKHLTQSRQGLKFFPFGQGRSYFVQMS